MDWDYQFHNQKNNLFRRQWSKPDQEDHRILTVTEVNRGLPCATCQKPVGEVASSFYEIDKQHYCLKCGEKVASAKTKGAGEPRSDRLAAATP